MRVDHVILAAGYPFRWTKFPGQVRHKRFLESFSEHGLSMQTDFAGEIIYSADFRSAKGLIGKKVVVIGACASGATK